MGNNFTKLPQLELAKVQGYQSMFNKLAKLPHLEPAIFQELLKLISLSKDKLQGLSLTLIQEDGDPENGIDSFWNFNHFFIKLHGMYERIKIFVWNLHTDEN